MLILPRSRDMQELGPAAPVRELFDAKNMWEASSLAFPAKALPPLRRFARRFLQRATHAIPDFKVSPRPL